ncbi:MAG: SDR family oxidoreductase [Bacteriovoracia bacterium]
MNSKNALVFGGSKGIGYGVAKALKESGYKVAICGRNPDHLETAKGKLKADLVIAGDISKPGEPKRVIQEAKRCFGSLQAFVFNTGGPKQGRFADLSLQDFQDGYQILMGSLFESLQEILPDMKKDKYGRIAIISSLSGREPIPNLLLSSTFRSGLLGFTKSVADEYAPFNITLNTVLPGLIDTERLRELGTPSEQLVKSVPAGRIGTTDEIGSFVATLLSEKTGYLTGQSIAFDGGKMRGF